MSLLKKAKVNKVSLDLANYMYYLQGVAKSGKTTFARDFIMEKYNDPEKGLLLAIGKEVGYKALNNIQALEIKSWKEFDAVVKELAETKGENGIEFVFIDTYDELIPMAEKEVMRLSQVATGKVCKTFNSAFGGYGQPRIELRKLVTEKISQLNDLYGLVVIGHTKLKTIKQQGALEDMEYQMLSSNLNEDYHNIVAHKADVIATVDVEKTITDNRLTETKTVLHLRNDGFVSAGCRFENIVDKVEFNAHNFIAAIEDAIKASSGMDESSFKKAQSEEVKRNEEQQLEKAKEVAKEIQDGNLPSKEELIEQVKTKMNDSNKKTVMSLVKGFGKTKITDLDASQINEILSKM